MARHLFLTLVCTLAFCNTSRLSAQEVFPEGQRLKDAVAIALARAVILLPEYPSLGFARGLNTLGAYIDEKESTSIRLSLEAGQSYVFIGGGDRYTVDLDIIIKNNNGEIVAQDSKTDNNPVVVYKPETSGTFSVALRLYESSTYGAFGAITWLVNGKNISIPVENIGRALGRTIDAANILENSVDIHFHNQDGQWCLFGAALGEKDHSEIYNLSLGSESHWFISAGDRSTSDLDLYLFDNNGLVSQSTGTETIPLMNFVTYSSALYKLKTTNYEGTGASMVFTLIMTQ